MDQQARIEQAMLRLGQNLAKVEQDPQAVLDANFTGVSESGAVTVWVDVMGRLERVHVVPGALADLGEKALIDGVLQANSRARAAAENLDMDGSRKSGSAQPEVAEDAEYFEEPQSFLE